MTAFITHHPGMRITEIFYSIQGESSYAGLPCAFVRLTWCNLRCAWCDSEYTFTGGTEMSVDEVLERVRGYGCRLVEVTGGEPLVQKRECTELVRRLCDEGFTVLVETGGSLDVSVLDSRAIKILDVKCPGSGEAHRNFWPNLERLNPQDEIKFVIADRADFDYALEVIEKYRLDQRAPFVLMSPVWGAVEWKDLAEWILQSGVRARLQLQMHKLIWGPDTKGV
ncbi:MAG TPA: radical SAM protein [Blastocatellia bacterium]|nr:radical SAM protein [Blastocatellia bacterium]